MKYKTLIKKLKLTDEDFSTIKAAVKEVEKQTESEIAVVITPESAHYSFWELLASNILAALVLFVMLPFSEKIREVYSLLYWHNAPSWIVPACFIISCFASVAIGFYLTNIPAIDRLIIPRHVKKTCVTNFSFRYFLKSGIYKTKNHSGILIFISYLEHQVRIVADEGIASKISQDLWNLIADELAEEIKKGNTTTAITNAVGKCGELLKEHYPRVTEKINEIDDSLVILEDSECE